MCKVSCRNTQCGKVFTVVGIVRRGESTYCSVQCCRAHLAEREGTDTAISIETFPKVPEVRTFADPTPFQHPRRIGMLCH